MRPLIHPLAVTLVLLTGPPAMITEATRGQGLAEGPAAPSAAQRTTPAKAKPGARRARRPAADEPPACPQDRPPSRPPARSMPELFQRMGEGLARDPATGFEAFLGELSRLEGPAVEGVALDAAEERRAGRRAQAEYLARAEARGYRVVEDPARLDYLRALVDRFAARMQHRDRYPRIDVTLIAAPVSDGQSFPGGSLVFTTALLEEPDEATVAGVVAHELAHLDRGHLYSYARRSKLAEATFARPPAQGDSFDQLFTRQAALFGLLVRPFRPEHEDEADCTAATWMFQEGYDPRALVDFFDRLHARKNDQPDNPFLAFARTHPFSLDRRDHVAARLAQLRRWRPGQDLGRYPDNLRRLTIRAR